jgi:hypothetical protein
MDDAGVLQDRAVRQRRRGPLIPGGAVGAPRPPACAAPPGA